MRRTFSHEPEPDPIYSCTTNPHTHLPVYTNIHRIRRDIVSVVEDYLSPEQLHDMRINLSVVRPLVDKLYELDDISIGGFFIFSSFLFSFISSLSLHTVSLVSSFQPCC